MFHARPPRAAGPIAKRFVKKGGDLAVPPEGFFVAGTEGPLKEGELERAADWASESSPNSETPHTCMDTNSPIQSKKRRTATYHRRVEPLITSVVWPQGDSRLRYEGRDRRLSLPLSWLSIAASLSDLPGGMPL